MLFYCLCFSPFCITIPSLGEESVNFSACLGTAAVFDCGTPWTFLLPFYGYSDSSHLKQNKEGTVIYSEV